MCLLRTPKDKEVESVVNGFQFEKSLDIYGITLEMLHRCWRFLKQDCYCMVKAFLRESLMSSTTLVGVIKMLPKQVDLGC